MRRTSNALSALLSATLPLTLAACSSPVARPAERDRTQPRIAIVLTNHAELGDTGRATGFYLSEASHPHRVFTDAGYRVDFVSPEGGAAPLDGVDRGDPINDAFLADPAIMAAVRDTPAIAEIDPAAYDAVFFAGGHGTMWDFPDHAGVQRLIRSVYESGGVVAAVCHGPAALANARLSDGTYLVNGLRVAAFTDEEEAAVELTGVVPFSLETRLRERGARIVKAPNFQQQVAVSERLVTGQNPASATATAEAVVRVLGQSPRDAAGED